MGRGRKRILFTWLACVLLGATIAACGPSLCGGQERAEEPRAQEAGASQTRAPTPAPAPRRETIPPPAARPTAPPQAPSPPPAAGSGGERGSADRIRTLEEAAARGGPEVAGMARGALEDALRTRDEALAEAAIEALEEIGGREALDALGQVLEADASTDLKLRALDGLELLDEPGASDRIALGLRDGDKRVRERAAEALGLLDDPAAVRPLWDALDREEDEWVRETILDSLELLGEDVERYYEEG